MGPAVDVLDVVLLLEKIAMLVVLVAVEVEVE